ncbi:helicase associated domain-containing protein [Streptomyces sp. NPDC001652]|uniref:helicase associated domain-containing protein n=1 Tax=Streptomyces sp. NPDC001652 TaxID=3154393 RepID=UPI00332218DB
MGLRRCEAGPRTGSWLRGHPRGRDLVAFHAREEHLRVPRQHLEDVDGELLGLRSFISNARRRATKLSPERHDALTALGMRW